MPALSPSLSPLAKAKKVITKAAVVIIEAVTKSGNVSGLAKLSTYSAAPCPVSRAK
ncbi:MAG: hypothetical protein QW434_02640 [Pyrobaculum sp.]